MDVWAIVGRLAVLATILTALFRFVSWWRAPKEKLVATVSPSLFALPPTVETEFSAAADKVQHSVHRFFERHPRKADGYDEAFYRAEMLASDIRHALERRLSYENRQFAGCWHARVDNNGKRKCSGVSLHLPHAAVARIQRDSDPEPVVKPVRGLIEIGELRPRGHCFVTAWTTATVENRDNYGVVLSHDGGVGRVFGQWTTSRLGWIFGTLVQRENLLSLLVPLILAILGMAIALLSFGSLASGARQKQPATLSDPISPSNTSATPHGAP